MMLATKNDAVVWLNAWRAESRFRQLRAIRLAIEGFEKIALSELWCRACGYQTTQNTAEILGVLEARLAELAEFEGKPALSDNETARAAARRMALAARNAPYRLTPRPYAHRNLGDLPASFARHAEARRLNVEAIRRAYRVAFSEGR